MVLSMLCWVTAAVALYAHSDASLDTDRKKAEAAKIGVDLDLKADVAEEGQHLPNATARLSAILGLEASKGLGFSAGDSKRTLQKLYSRDAGVGAGVRKGVLPDVGMREHVAFNHATLATGADQADGHPHAHARRRADGRGGWASVRGAASSDLGTAATCAATKCVGERQSQIVLTGFQGVPGAGIGDRAHIFEQMANVAELFCARLVVVGRPCDAMGGHGDISCEAKWSDYIRLVARGETQLLVSVLPDDADLGAPAASKLTPLRNAFQPYARPQNAPCTDGFECLGPQSARYLIAEQVDKVVQAQKRGSPFVWYLEGPNFYSWSKEIEHEMKNIKQDRGLSWPPCEIVKLAASEPVLEACKKVQTSFGLGATYSTMHIRRGDATADCDTSRAAVRAFTAEHVVPAVAPGSKLIVFTDETDADYLAEIKADFADANVEALHGDEAVQAAGGAAAFSDNYFTMQVQGALNGHCTGAVDQPSFRMDRQSCEVG